MVLVELYSRLDGVFKVVARHSKAPCRIVAKPGEMKLLTNHYNTLSVTTMTALRFLTFACTQTHSCRRLLLHAQFIAPHAHSLPFPSSISNKPISRRAFVSTQPHRAAPAPTPPTTLAILRRSPTAEDIEAAELDVLLPPQSDTLLVLTERAAEVCCNFTCLRWAGIDMCVWAATPSNIFSRRIFGFGPANFCRIGGMSWISI
jgi:hypothetical protein